MHAPLVPVVAPSMKAADVEWLLPSPPTPPPAVPEELLLLEPLQLALQMATTGQTHAINTNPRWIFMVCTASEPNVIAAVTARPDNRIERWTGASLRRAPTPHPRMCAELARHHRESEGARSVEIQLKAFETLSSIARQVSTTRAVQSAWASRRRDEDRGPFVDVHDATSSIGNKEKQNWRQT